jgi:hypothetical protein
VRKLRGFLAEFLGAFKMKFPELEKEVNRIKADMVNRGVNPDAYSFDLECIGSPENRVYRLVVKFKELKSEEKLATVTDLNEWKKEKARAKLLLRLEKDGW